MTDLRDRLRDLRVDPPDQGFGAALHRRLAAEEAPREPSWWRRLLRPEQRILWPALGAAAALAVVVLAVRTQRPQPSPQQLAAAVVPATKVALVRVNLSAEVAVEGAQIRVKLPDGLYFWSDGEELAQREFEWTQPLSAGDNEIPIGVRGRAPGKYKMTVTAQIGSERVEDEVLIEVVKG